MTTQTVRDDGSPSPMQTSRGPLLRWLLVGALVVVVVVALVVTVWQWRHPTLFTPGDDRVGVWGDLAVGESVYVGMSYPDQELDEPVTVQVDSVEPRLVGDGAADVAFFVCRIDLGAGVGAFGSGGQRGVERDCAELVDAAGADMTVRAKYPDQIVMKITRTGPGPIRISRMDVTYSGGWQHGTQWAGESVRFTEG